MYAPRHTTRHQLTSRSRGKSMGQRDHGLFRIRSEDLNRPI